MAFEVAVESDPIERRPKQFDIGKNGKTSDLANLIHCESANVAPITQQRGSLNQ